MIINTPVDRGNEIEVVKNTLGYTVGKNLLKPVGKSWTNQDVQLTQNDDGSVTLNGTATGYGSFIIAEASTISLPYGEYILSGCPEGGSASTYDMCVWVNDNYNKFYDYGDGVNFTLDSDNHIYRIYIDVIKGQTYDNLTFYPMIRKAHITDDTYEPYKEDVDTRLNDVDTRLNTVESDLEWKLYGEIQGGTNVILPSEWNELNLVTAIYNSSNKRNMLFRTKIDKTELMLYKNKLSQDVIQLNDYPVGNASSTALEVSGDNNFEIIISGNKLSSLYASSYKSSIYYR